MSGPVFFYFLIAHDRRRSNICLTALGNRVLRCVCGDRHTCIGIGAGTIAVGGCGGSVEVRHH